MKKYFICLLIITISLKASSQSSAGVQMDFLEDLFSEPFNLYNFNLSVAGQNNYYIGSIGGLNGINLRLSYRFTPIKMISFGYILSFQKEYVYDKEFISSVTGAPAINIPFKKNINIQTFYFRAVYCYWNTFDDNFNSYFTTGLDVVTNTINSKFGNVPPYYYLHQFPVDDVEGINNTNRYDINLGIGTSYGFKSFALFAETGILFGFYFDKPDIVDESGTFHISTLVGLRFRLPD